MRFVQPNTWMKKIIVTTGYMQGKVHHCRPANGFAIDSENHG